MKMKPRSELVVWAEHTLRDVLEQVPFINIQSIEREKHIGKFIVGIFVNITIGSSKEQSLIVELNSNGQPRFARIAINQLLRYREACPEAYLIFMAPYISPQTADICKEDGIGHIDFAGNCFISFGELYIKQIGEQNTHATRRDLISLFAVKSSRVLRVLLGSPWKVWRMQEIADEARVSLGQVGNVYKLLLDREWIKKDHDGVSLIEPCKLLNDWANAYTFRKNELYNYFSPTSIPEIEAYIADICTAKGIEYALTGFSAAARLIPTINCTYPMVYVNSIEDVVSSLVLKDPKGGLKTGKLFTLLLPYDSGVLYGTRVIEDIKVVSPMQAYIDIKRYRGEWEKAADAIMENIIKPEWSK
ncbi:MAG: hypothetical protein HQK96_19200 [Nitrospirae bacterium]|nr:hypothetical protein [Nitrospirota bacterium]